MSASSTHAGVAGSNSYGGNGVYGERVGDVGYAGYFVGPVHVQGTLSKTAGSFRIDHPSTRSTGTCSTHSWNRRTC